LIELKVRTERISRIKIDIFFLSFTITSEIFLGSHCLPHLGFPWCK
jgi:hypothetical protein